VVGTAGSLTGEDSWAAGLEQAKKNNDTASPKTNINRTFRFSDKFI